jgi:hypothetical protein
MHTSTSRATYLQQKPLHSIHSACLFVYQQQAPISTQHSPHAVWALLAT